MQSSQAGKFYLRITPKTLKETIDQIKKLNQLEELKSNFNEKDHELASKIVKFYYEKLKAHPDQDAFLSMEEHFELAKILIQVSDKGRNNAANVGLQALKSAFGGAALTELKKIYWLSMADFSKKCALPKATAPAVAALSERKASGPQRTIADAADSKSINNPDNSSDFEQPSSKSIDDPDNRILPTIFAWPSAPREVAPEDLDDNGRLRVTMQKEIMAAIEINIAAGIRSGRIRKETIEKQYGKKPTCSAAYFFNEAGQLEVYALYKGRKHRIPEEELGYVRGEIYKNSTRHWGRLAGAGSYGGFKIAQKWVGDDKKDSKENTGHHWHGVKIKRQDEMDSDDIEFPTGKKQGLAIAHFQRPSPSHNNSVQEEIIMHHLPGKDFYSVSNRKLHPLFLLNIIVNLLQKVIDFHNHNEAAHCDLKYANLILFGTDVSIIDFGTVTKWDKHTRSIKASNLKTTAGYHSAALASTLLYDVSTEMYALGMIIAKIDYLFTRESVKIFNDFFHLPIPPEFKLVSADSKEFDSDSSRIFDTKEDRVEALNFVRGMVGAPDAVQPKNLEVCRDFYQNCIAKKRETSTLKVCFIDVTAFNAADKDEREKILAYAEQFDVVQGVLCHHIDKPKMLMLAHRAFSDKLTNLIGQQLINLRDYGVDSLLDRVKECKEWYPLGKTYQYSFLDTGLGFQMKAGAAHLGITVDSLDKMNRDYSPPLGYSSGSSVLFSSYNSAASSPATPGKKLTPS